MTPPRRKRSVQLNFRVSEEELAAIESKMEQLGIFNREAYLRKMALDGYAVRLDLPELKELLSLLRRHSSNLNQLVRRVNTTGRVYEGTLGGHWPDTDPAGNSIVMRWEDWRWPSSRFFVLWQACFISLTLR